MKRFFLSALIWCCGATLEVCAQDSSAHTPPPGSPERQEICDAARAYVLGHYATGRLPQAIVFKIDHLRVQGAYANLGAIPLFKDGSYIGTEYMPDIAFNFCLQKGADRWEIIADLSRTDVPDAAEAEAIRHRLPADFPLALLAPFWRDLLRER